MKRILLVEADDEFRKQLVNKFNNEKYEIDVTESPIRGLEYVARQDYDVVISDLELPIMSGIEFIESIKNISKEVICILLTENHDEQSELASIQNNIDLYFEKNKSAFILLYYVERLLEQKESELTEILILESLAEKIILNVNEHTVMKADAYVELTPKEYEFLKIFLENKNKVMSREDFVYLAWEEPEEEVDLRLVDSHVKKLRDKLKIEAILTVRGYGYRWNEIE